MISKLITITNQEYGLMTAIMFLCGAITGIIIYYYLAEARKLQLQLKKSKREEERYNRKEIIEYANSIQNIKKKKKRRKK